MADEVGEVRQEIEMNKINKEEKRRGGKGRRLGNQLAREKERERKRQI